LSAPAAFELQQTIIIRFRSAETEAFEAVAAAPFDGLPHHQVVGPQVMIISVRGAVLVDDLRAEMKEHVSGHYLGLIGNQRNKPFFTRNYAVKYFPEKVKRLRRQTVLFAGGAVQPVKFFNGFKGIAKIHF